MIGVTTLAVAPWADTQVIVAIITTVGVIGGAGGLWDYLKARKRTTITAKEHEEAAAKADAAAADDIVKSAMTIVNKWEAMAEGITRRHDSEMKKVHDRLDAETTRGDRLEIEVEALKRESREQSRTIFILRTALVRVETWWETEIVARWDIVRQDPDPPTFPTTNTE